MTGHQMDSNFYHPFINSYLDKMENGIQSREIHQAAAYVREKLSRPFVRIDSDKINRAVELMEKYFNMKLFPWEKFVVALVHCYDERNDTVIFDEFLLVMGRGNGKNGFISALIWYLTSAAHGVKGYNVDIIANSESQAKTSFDDVYNVIKTDKSGKLAKQFDAKKPVIMNRSTQSTINYNTANAHTKDGKRSACLVFDEMHEYESWDMINVFMSGFGKRRHSRIFYITTNGHVRGGVLDEQLKMAHDVLSGEIKDLGLLPLIYKIDDKEEADDEACWYKANPSLEYLPVLMQQMRKDYAKMKYRPSAAVEFLTKRMNCPAQDTFNTIATPEQVNATNRKIPYDALNGMPCIGAVDYASVKDFCSCGLLFLYQGIYYLIEHTFVCHKSLEMESRHFKFPVEEMAERGLITIVQTDTITPDVVAEWFTGMAHQYEILDIKADDYRRSLLNQAFEQAGLPLTSVRSGARTHTVLSPLVDSIFAEHKLVVGDNPTMRWYINNVRQEMDKKGNIQYVKIEPMLRKTDGFFMLLHALTGASELPDSADCQVQIEMKPIIF